MAFNTTIAQLSGTSTFYDWFIKENSEIIAKLNQITASGVTSGNGIFASTDSSGLVTLALGGTAGAITTGITFSGPVSFLGETVVPNASFKVTGITSGTSGYTFGTVVRVTSTGYTAAKANSADNAEVIGVISARNSAYSVVTVSGKVDGDFTGVAGATLSPGCVYFLDGTTAGFISTTEPTTVGQVSKPVIIGLGATSGMVVQYRGNYLNASTSSGGESGTNRLYISLPTTPDITTYGFTAGSFVSYAPDLLSGSTFFNKVLTDTGRTAFSGWFLSGSRNFIYRGYSYGTPYYNLPSEEDYIVGMIENVTKSGANYICQIIARGTSSVIPKALPAAARQQGAWCISGATYTASVMGATGQLVSNPTTNNNPYLPVYQVGFAFANSPTSWYVNPRPLSNAPITTSFRSAQSPSTLANWSNYAFNGDFSIWQRDTGKASQYTSTGNVYFADNWIRRMSGITGVQTLQRQSFTTGTSSVEGNPQYYIDIKALTSPASTTPINSVYSVGCVIDGIDTFSNSSITVGFYAMCQLPNYTANVYFARYSGGSLVSKTTIGTINLQTTWTKHTINYDVDTLASGSYTNDYVEIGIDLNPQIYSAYSNSIATSTNTTVSIASFVVYNGTYSTPQFYFENYTDKFERAQKYYYTTYIDSQTSGSSTMLSNIEPVLNTFSLTHLPNSPFGVLKFPVRMRTTPTLSVYSPLSGLSSEMYNYTAGRDLRNTSSTKGYGDVIRVAPNGVATVSLSGDTTSVRVNIGAGSVPYDVINCHIVADASYPI